MAAKCGRIGHARACLGSRRPSGPILVYFFLIVGLRVAGKRELAQLNPFDLIVLLTLSNTVQNAIIGNDNSVSGGFIGATTLLVVNYLVVRTVRRSKRLQRLLEGRIRRAGVARQAAGPQPGEGTDEQGRPDGRRPQAGDRVAEGRGALRPGADRHHHLHREEAGHEAERHDQLLALLGQIREDLTLLQAERAGGPGERNRPYGGACWRSKRREAADRSGLRSRPWITARPPSSAPTNPELRNIYARGRVRPVSSLAPRLLTGPASDTISRFDQSALQPNPAAPLSFGPPGRSAPVCV